MVMIADVANTEIAIALNPMSSLRIIFLPRSFPEPRFLLVRLRRGLSRATIPQDRWIYKRLMDHSFGQLCCRVGGPVRGRCTRRLHHARPLRPVAHCGSSVCWEPVALANAR